MSGLIHLIRLVSSLFGERKPRTLCRGCRARLKVELLEGRLAPAAYVWTDGTGDGSWSNPGNWKIGLNVAAAAPGQNDDVTFNNSNDGGPASCTLDTATAVTVRSITLQPTYVGTLTLAQNLTVTGAFSMAGLGEIGGGILTLNGGGTWSRNSPEFRFVRVPSRTGTLASSATAALKPRRIAADTKQASQVSGFACHDLRNGPEAARLR